VISAIVHDPEAKTLTIEIGGRVIVFEYNGHLPADWETRAPDYEEQAKNILNGLLEVRTRAFDWYEAKGIAKTDPEYMNHPSTERQWLEGSGGSADIVFLDVICTQAVWNPARAEYLFSIRVTSANNPHIPA
jgi:hypothetical protein